MPSLLVVAGACFAVSFPALAQDAAPSSAPDAGPPMEAVEAVVAPPSWEQTFAPDLVAGYLPSGQVKLVVVAAGPASPDRDGAAAAFAAAVRAGGRVQLAANPAGLADLAELDDEDVVLKTDKATVTHVAVLRLFDAAEGQPARAVVSIYRRKSGTLAAALTVQQGDLLESRLPSTDPSLGVSAQAVESVSEIGETASRSKTLRGKYASRKIRFAASPDDDEWIEPYVGSKKRKRFLAEDDFYRLVGREDLAARSGRQQLIRSSVIGSATLVAIGGLIFALSAGDSPEGTVGLSVAAAGGLVAFGTSFWTPHAATLAEVRALASRYNEGLREELELEHEDARSPERVRFSVAPQVGPRQGGITFALAF